MKPIYAGIIIIFSALLATPPRACELALLLAVDVSGSIDANEYDIQLKGLAAGLNDGVVSEALVKLHARIALVQWSGSTRQEISVNWHSIRRFEDIDRFVARVESAPRPWQNYSTAIGEALAFSMQALEPVSDCERRVIDLSGDGLSNEGIEPQTMRENLSNGGISVNALAIEGAVDDLTGYFWENVITGEGSFVVTANGFNDYASKMKLKLRKETTVQLSHLR